MRPLPRSSQESLPRSWVRWLAALLFAMLFAAAGLFPQSLQTAIKAREHAWINTSGVGALLRAHPASGASSRRSFQAGPPARWRSPVAHAKIVQEYGWYEERGVKKFSQGVVVTALSGKAVLMPATGVVVRVGQSWESLKIGKDTVTFSGMEPAAAHPGATWDGGADIGKVQGRLSVQVSVGGLPVNPLTAQYFGTQWLHR